MRIFACVWLLFSSTTLISAGQSHSRDSLFSITPEQMVFAAKLSESYRKLYCHQFSMVERQEALDEWLAAREDQAETAGLSPDDAVREIAEQSLSDREDPFLRSSGDAS